MVQRVAIAFGCRVRGVSRRGGRTRTARWWKRAAFFCVDGRLWDSVDGRLWDSLSRPAAGSRPETQAQSSDEQRGHGNVGHGRPDEQAPLEKESPSQIVHFWQPGRRLDDRRDQKAGDGQDEEQRAGASEGC
ncbi:MAG: hypothetical protein D6725_12165 [Planctomycetota bacterium]|nr:MAG: hypothetical protein D6725_12165 [Planctomycetota bacterium]